MICYTKSDKKSETTVILLYILVAGYTQATSMQVYAFNDEKYNNRHPWEDNVTDSRQFMGEKEILKDFLLFMYL